MILRQVPGTYSGRLDHDSAHRWMRASPAVLCSVWLAEHNFPTRAYGHVSAALLCFIIS